MTISNKIKRLRKAAKISQVELAKKLGTTKQTIYKYENGLITNIPSDKIEIMASLFDTTPQYLMGWEDLPNANNSEIPPETVETASMIHEAENTEEILDIVETVIEDDDYRAIVTASKELNPEEMKMVRAMIEGLVNKKD